MSKKIPALPFDLPKKKPNGKSIHYQKIKYPCGCEAIGIAPMPGYCPTHGDPLLISGTTITPASKQKVHVAIILDESGSMESCRQQTIDGFNTYLKTLQEDDKSEYVMTLTKFDSYFGDPVCREVYSNALIEKATGLSMETFTPRGSTPMYDAIGQSVNKISESSADKFIVVTLTDGGENSSTEFNKDSVKKLIAQKEALGNWTFVYLGANQDAWAEASRMGFQSGNVANFATAHTANVMSCLATDTMSYGSSILRSTSSLIASSAGAIGSAGNFTYGVPSPSQLGSLGGKKRTAGMTKEQLKEAAKVASQARWRKNK
jgi:hypothetical protein